MNHTTWIISADASKAKIFSACKARLLNKAATDNDLTLVSEHEHSQSRKKDSELVSDKQGSYGNGNFAESTDPKRHEEEVFAHELAKTLEQGRNKGSYDDLILIAPPAFMGMLNKCLSTQVSKIVSLSIEKDYVHHNERELMAQLKGYL